jgi:hypothetical protein
VYPSQNELPSNKMTGNGNKSNSTATLRKIELGLYLKLACDTYAECQKSFVESVKQSFHSHIDGKETPNYLTFDQFAEFLHEFHQTLPMSVKTLYECYGEAMKRTDQRDKGVTWKACKETFEHLRLFDHDFTSSARHLYADFDNIQTKQRVFTHVKECYVTMKDNVKALAKLAGREDSLLSTVFSETLAAVSKSIAVELRRSTTKANPRVLMHKFRQLCDEIMTFLKFREEFGSRTALQVTKKPDARDITVEATHLSEMVNAKCASFLQENKSAESSAPGRV